MGQASTQFLRTKYDCDKKIAYHKGQIEYLKGSSLNKEAKAASIADHKRCIEEIKAYRRTLKE